VKATVEYLESTCRSHLNGDDRLVQFA
jgi:hypothetical protein